MQEYTQLTDALQRSMAAMLENMVTRRIIQGPALFFCLHRGYSAPSMITTTQQEQVT